jgi:hypothetical protein
MGLAEERTDGKSQRPPPVISNNFAGYQQIATNNCEGNAGAIANIDSRF